MTTASTLAQLASFAITSRSSRALAACVSSDFVNAKTSSFWKVTAASQRAATGAGAGEGGGGGATSRRAGGGAGRDSGAGWGCGAGSGAVAQDASRQRTELPIASFRFFKGSSWSWTRRALLSCAQLLRRRGSYTTWASGNEFSEGKSPDRERESGGSKGLKLIKFHSLKGYAAARKHPRAHGSIRQGNAARQPGRGDAPLLPRLRDERDRGARAARRARRAEAGAPQGALRDVRDEQRVEPALREMRARGRRRPRQIPSSRRQRHLRGAGAHGAGLLDALHADRRAGKLRLDRRRPGCGLPLHRVPPGPHRLGAARRHREGNRRFRGELRRQGAGTVGAADQGPESAHQRLLGDRRGHGDEYSAT